MGKIIFHIGIGKSGTTFLQECFFNKLTDCANLGRPNHANQLYRDFLYGITMAEDNEAEQYIQPFARLVHEKNAQYPIIIISDEALQNRYPYSYSITRLKSFFPSAEILITIRNQLTALQSYYCHSGNRLKYVPAADTFNRKKQVSFDDFVSFCINGNYNDAYAERLKYKRLFCTIEQYFLKEKIHVLLFEEMAKEINSFLGHMTKILNRDLAELQEIWNQGKPKNTRQSKNILRYQKLRTKIPLKSIRQSLPGMKYLLPKIEKWLKKGKAVYSPQYTTEQIKTLKLIYAKENEYLQTTYHLNLKKWGYPL